MKLSTRTYYGLKALADLAVHKNPRSAREIAQTEAIPLEFLEKILQTLRKNGLILSKRGKYGGYVLAHSAKEITLSDVFGELEGPLIDIPCLTKTCSHANSCRTKDVWHHVNQILDNTFSEITLQQIANRTIQTPFSQEISTLSHLKERSNIK